MTTRGCLLVSASCIVLPPVKKGGVFCPELVEGAKESMIALKKKFATDIYVLLCSKQYQEQGASWLRGVHFYNENQQDHDIVGTDRVIGFSKSGLESLIQTTRITHVISDDSIILESIPRTYNIHSASNGNGAMTMMIERYLLGFAPTDDDSISCFPTWEELTRAILMPWQ